MFSQAGVAWAKATLGSLYHLGLGVPEDLKRAEGLYFEAYNGGIEWIASNLECVYQQTRQWEKANAFTQECKDKRIGLYQPPP